MGNVCRKTLINLKNFIEQVCIGAFWFINAVCLFVLIQSVILERQLTVLILELVSFCLKKKKVCGSKIPDRK